MLDVRWNVFFHHPHFIIIHKEQRLRGIEVLWLFDIYITNVWSGSDQIGKCSDHPLPQNQTVFVAANPAPPKADKTRKYFVRISYRCNHSTKRIETCLWGCFGPLNRNGKGPNNLRINTRTTGPKVSYGAELENRRNIALEWFIFTAG